MSLTAAKQKAGTFAAHANTVAAMSCLPTSARRETEMGVRAYYMLAVAQNAPERLAPALLANCSTWISAVDELRRLIASLTVCQGRE